MEYIAQDSIFQAIKFQEDLDEFIDDIPNMPFKYRKSIYFMMRISGILYLRIMLYLIKSILVKIKSLLSVLINIWINYIKISL